MIAALSGLMACAGNPVPESSRAEVFDPAGYRAAGNEPFWQLVFDETTMEFTRLGSQDTITAIRPEPQRLGDVWHFTAVAQEEPYLVEVEERRCSDSMSGRPYPHSVTVTVSGQTYTGCGGESASLLVGEEWRVTRLEDAAVPPTRPPTLLFAAGGVLSGDGGCNRFRSTFEITGEGLAIGPAAATRMACAEPERNAQETRFFQLLERVDRFAIAEDGSLQLIAADLPLIVAER